MLRRSIYGVHMIFRTNNPDFAEGGNFECFQHGRSSVLKLQLREIHTSVCRSIHKMRGRVLLE
jgi:hypothetical protein